MKVKEDKEKLGWFDRGVMLTFLPFVKMSAWRAGGLWGVAALVVLLIFGRHQITPGREWVNLGWPVGVYYAIVAVAGATVGFSFGERRGLGMVGTMISAVSSFAVGGLLLHFLPQPPVLVNWWAWINVVGLAIGFLPGVILYGLADHLLERSNEAAAKLKADARLQRRR